MLRFWPARSLASLGMRYALPTAAVPTAAVSTAALPFAALRAGSTAAFSRGAKPKPVDVHVIRTGGDEEDRIGHVGRAQHSRAWSESLAMIRVERVPGPGISRPW